MLVVSSGRRRWKNSVKRVEPFRCAWTGEGMGRRGMMGRRRDEWSIFVSVYIIIEIILS